MYIDMHVCFNLIGNLDSKSFLFTFYSSFLLSVAVRKVKELKPENSFLQLIASKFDWDFFLLDENIFIFSVARLS